MSFLVGSAKSQAAQQSAVSGLQLQSSAYGKAIPIVYGTTRIAPNLIWYGDFVATPQNSSAGGGGGKGGVAGSGGKSGNTGTSYIYQTALALGICEGPIQGVGNVYVSKSVTTIAALGLSQFLGAYGQAAWGYISTSHPSQAITYSGIAYLAAGSYPLGSNADLPNHNFEVSGFYANNSIIIPNRTIPDADPSLVVADLLTNTRYGAGLPAARLGNLSVYQDTALRMASGFPRHNAPLTGSIAGNFNAFRSSGSATGTMAASVETARTDSLSGNRQVFTFSIGGGTTGEQFNFGITDSNLSTYSINVGDTIVAECDMWLSGHANVNQLLLQINFYNASFSATVQASDGDTITDKLAGGGQFMALNGDSTPMSFRTPPVVVPATTTNFTCYATIGFDGSGGAGSATATWKVGNFRVRKVV